MKNKITKPITKPREKLILAARKMPPLFHKLPGVNFDISKSKVVKWLIHTPEAKTLLWESIQNVYGDKCPIEYDLNTGLWKGKDYES